MSDSTELEALRGIYVVWKDISPEVAADLSRKVRAALATKDAEIARLKNEADLWWNVAKRRGKGCPEGHSPGESRGACWFCDAERNAKDLAALREAVGALPEYAHSLPCPHEDYDCACGTDAANAALVAARKLAGVGE